MSEADVKAWQVDLNARGARLVLDGDFGPATLKASREAAGMTADDPSPPVTGGAASIPDEAIDLIKEFEGFRANAYQDSVGVWTIGYGTTAAAGLGINPMRGMVITEADAERYLQAGVAKFAAQIAPMIKVPVTPNEFGALVSLAYNIGPGAFSGSTVLRRLNAGDKAGAAAAFSMWNKAGGQVLAGLTRRRAAEAALFRKP